MLIFKLVINAVGSIVVIQISFHFIIKYLTTTMQTVQIILKVLDVIFARFTEQNRLVFDYRKMQCIVKQSLNLYSELIR